MRIAGKIVAWKDDRGFGFIAPAVGGDDLFVHIRSFLNRSRRPVEQEVVTFEQSIGENGRPQAVKVAFDGEPVVAPRGISIQILMACGFLLGLAALAIIGRLSWWVAGLYSAISVVAFYAYWVDKVAARNGHRRTPEQTLLLFGLLGGWPGAIIAQQVLRHKNRKASFQAAFWISVVVNCGLLLYIASP